ncbi:MAG: phospholipid carrier-dependent glycosyltransferase [Acidobacteria bacterium]|nr:phospholipid carrier-dependent glycosyltransferase [Acidobacteriota bacterium]
MPEREWREASDMRTPSLLVITVLVVAALLRFWNLGAGIPFAIQVDEPEIALRAVRMMKTGDFNPHFFDYGGLYIYLQLVVACVRFIFGAAIQGLWSSLDQASPDNFYAWGRGLTAMLGTATVLIVYNIGTRWGARHALLAGGLMAVVPFHVRESHFVLTDVPLTFFTTLTMLLTLRAHESERVSRYAWAGVAAGLAAATKYNGGLVLMLPLLSAALSKAGLVTRIQMALASLGACVAAFLLAAPYTVLDLPTFLNQFAHLASIFAAEPRSPEPGWLTYLKHLRLALGWPALLLMFGGLGLGIFRAIQGPGNVRWLLAIVFPLTYFYLIATRSQIYGRYLLPILPFACVLAACAVVSGVSLLRRFDIPRAPRTALIVALTLAALVPPTVEAVRFCRMIGRTSTQQLAYTWIMSNIPRGSRIAIEARGLLLPEPRYRVEHFPKLTLHEYQNYRDDGFEYMIAHSQSFGAAFAEPHSHAAEYAEYRRLFDQASLLTTFEPSEDHPGPELRIFKLQ